MLSNANDNDTGFLAMITGPMYSGKSSYLCNVKNQCDMCNISNVVVDNAKIYHDNAHKNSMYTHNGNCISALVVHNLHQINLTHEKVILINEGQFFEGIYDWVRYNVENSKKHIYIACLDGDYMQRPFSSDISKLMSYADEIIVLKSLCKFCNDGTKAPFTVRLSSEKDEIVVDGCAQYAPACRKCFNDPLKNIHHKYINKTI